MSHFIPDSCYTILHMKQYIPKSFSLNTFGKISSETHAEHVKLYEGYVKHFNLCREHTKTLLLDTETHSYEIGELKRRLSFEWNGIQNHELYFSLLEKSVPRNTDSLFSKKIESQYGSYETFEQEVIQTGLTRGIGWVFVSYSKNLDEILIHWVDEQHLGHMQNMNIIFGIDVWEHAYVADYAPSGKKQYIKDILSFINWEVIEGRYQDIVN
jgi:superoxide dismutase, Fe-Mn family